jgi:hypothetical protein
MVVVGQFRAREVVAKVAGGQDGDQVGGGHARGRMPRSRLGAGTDSIDADLLRDLTDEIERRKRSRLDTAGHGHVIHLR